MALTDQQKNQNIQLNQVDPNAKDLFTISAEDFKRQIQVLQREDIHITLPAADIFSEEMRVIVTNTGADNQVGFYGG